MGTNQLSDGYEVRHVAVILRGDTMGPEQSADVGLSGREFVNGASDGRCQGLHSCKSLTVQKFLEGQANRGSCHHVIFTKIHREVFCTTVKGIKKCIIQMRVCKLRRYSSVSVI